MLGCMEIGFTTAFEKPPYEYSKSCRKRRVIQQGMDAPIAYQSASHSPCMGVREWTLFAKNLVGLQVCSLQLSRMMAKGIPAEVLLCEVSNWQVRRRSARAASEGQYGGDVG